MQIKLYFDSEHGSEPFLTTDVTGSELHQSCRVQVEHEKVVYEIFGVRDVTRTNAYQLALIIPRFKDEEMAKIYKMYPLTFSIMQEVDPDITRFMQNLTAKAKELNLLDKLVDGAMK